MIVVGAPVRNRAWILPEYLDAIYGIWQADHKLRDVFLVDNSTDNTEQILRARAWKIELMPSGAAVKHPRCEYGKDGFRHLAAVRNRFVELFLETDAEFLLSVDSDVIVPPNILHKLLPLAADGRTIVAAAISNIPGQQLDGYSCGNFQVRQGGLLMHPTGDAVNKIPGYPLSGTMEVDNTGACCLYPRAVFNAGVRFSADPQGEDAAFCTAAKAAGFRIFVSFDVRPEHRMTEIQAGNTEPCSA